MKLRALGLLLAAVAGCGRPPAPVAARQPAPAFGKVSGAPSTRGWFLPERESTVVKVEAGVAGDRIATLVDLPESSCAVIIARGTDTIEDLDLMAYGEDGAVLGMDEGADKTPALLVCPPHPKRLYLSARIAAGHGLVALGIERMPLKDSETAAKQYNAKHRGDEAEARLAAWPGLAERIAEHRQRLGGKWTDVRRVAVPLDARLATRLSASVEANRCLHALVLGGDDVSHIELSVSDDEGHILGRAASLGRDRSLVVCSPLTSTVSLELRPQVGRGISALVLSQSEPGVSSDVDDAVRIDRFAGGTLDDARQKSEARLSGLGYPKAKVVKTGTLQPGRLDSTAFSLPKGCSRLDILSASPVREVTARLWGADDALIAEADGRATPTLFACSRGGPVRLDTETLARPGEYSVELRLEPNSTPSLEGSPLAASRLLGSMIERGLVRTGAQAGRVSEHPLSPDRLDTEQLLVPAGRCIDVTLALGLGMSGAELRLVDEGNGEELALARGTYVTTARACALDARSGGTLRARAEYRVSAGQGVGLSTTRTSTPGSSR